MNERTWHITIAKLIGIAGFVLAAATLNTAARYVAICLFCSGIYMQAGIGPGWVGATCGQTKEKRAVALAMTNTVNTIAPIYTSVSFVKPWCVTDLADTPLSTCGSIATRLGTPPPCQPAPRSRWHPLALLGSLGGRSSGRTAGSSSQTRRQLYSTYTKLKFSSIWS